MAISLISIIAFSQPTETLLVGYPEVNYYAGAPLHNTVWKAFRTQAVASGVGTTFRMYFWNFSWGVETDNEVGYALYEDNNGRVGTLKMSGYIPHYNWTIVGENTYHDFPLDVVYTDRNIVAGRNYWVVFQASGGENLLISRGRTSSCDNNLKIGAGYTCCEVAPPPNTYDIIYNSGCYGWAVWEIGISPQPEAPNNLRVVQ